MSDEARATRRAQFQGMSEEERATRIAQLESSIQDQPEDDEAQATVALPLTGQSTVDTPVSNLNPAVTTDNLVKAGIDAELAADIVRRRNEIDMQLLELRDRAAR